MFKHYFENVQYAEVGPMIGLVIFFIFFIVLVYTVIKADKGFIKKMKNLPLDEKAADENRSTSTHT